MRIIKLPMKVINDNNNIIEAILYVSNRNPIMVRPGTVSRAAIVVLIERMLFLFSSGIIIKRNLPLRIFSKLPKNKPAIITNNNSPII